MLSSSVSKYLSVLCGYLGKRFFCSYLITIEICKAMVLNPILKSWLGFRQNCFETHQGENSFILRLECKWPIKGMSMNFYMWLPIAWAAYWKKSYHTNGSLRASSAVYDIAWSYWSWCHMKLTLQKKRNRGVTVMFKSFGRILLSYCILITKSGPTQYSSSLF